MFNTRRAVSNQWYYSNQWYWCFNMERNEDFWLVIHYYHRCIKNLDDLKNDV